MKGVKSLGRLAFQFYKEHRQEQQNIWYDKANRVMGLGNESIDMILETLFNPNKIAPNSRITPISV